MPRRAKYYEVAVREAGTPSYISRPFKTKDRKEALLYFKSEVFGLPQNSWVVYLRYEDSERCKVVEEYTPPPPVPIEEQHTIEGWNS